ncbi:unnamed protein product [Parajaminaea phylloscopi]
MPGLECASFRESEADIAACRSIGATVRWQTGKSPAATRTSPSSRSFGSDVEETDRTNPRQNTHTHTHSTRQKRWSSGRGKTDKKRRIRR